MSLRSSEALPEQAERARTDDRGAGLPNKATGSDRAGVRGVTAQACSGSILELERRLEERFRGYHVRAVSSGTAALEVIMHALGISHGSKVLVPEYGFPAAALAAMRMGAKVDLGRVEVPGLTLRPAPLWGYDAVVGIDVGGYPADWKEIERHAEHVVEDACAAWGGISPDGPCGGFGDAAAFSLSATKVLPAGEGGVIVTRHGYLVERVEMLRRYGEDSDSDPLRRKFVVRGGNWKMAEPVARVALDALEGLDERLERGRQVRRLWDSVLGECNYLFEVPAVHDGISPHKYRVLAPGSGGRLRDVAADAGLPLLEDEVPVLHSVPGSLFYDAKRSSDASDTLASSFVIPSRERPIWTLREEEVDKVADGLMRLDGRADEWLS